MIMIAEGPCEVTAEMLRPFIGRTIQEYSRIHWMGDTYPTTYVHDNRVFLEGNEVCVQNVVYGSGNILKFILRKGQ